MRSVIAFAALALTGALNFAAASPCKASGSITASSNDDPTTTTASEPSSTTSSTPSLVKNAITNGNLADPGSGSGVPGFSTSGTVVVAVGEGYTGDGSTETNCVKASAGSPATENSKRSDPQLSSFSQEVRDLETGTSYTVRFAYAVVSVSGAGACTLEVSLGSESVKVLSITAGSSLAWATTVSQVAATAATADLLFAITCQTGGSTVLYIDSIFMSNKVTPATIDDTVIDYGSPSLTSSVVATLSPSTHSTASAPATTTAPTTTSSRPATRTLSTGTLTPSATCPGGVVPTALATCVPRDPVPQAPTTCSAFGVKGYTWWGRARFASPNQNSIEDCAKLCYQQAINCKAFAWFADFYGSPICALGYDSLAEDGITLGATGSVMWNDLDCYKCDECPTT
ncbi:hypothetical protein AK830_g3259 [Neonectria ditissima]|uniref:Apple domain-containing protein n=1 Tax=Neonectria ditissima TaxID=78410 RepID=A0A0N8H811_9HYPO|nr:hypothetical protein AK830_g3259 [Neonectria ditissima]